MGIWRLPIGDRYVTAVDACSENTRVRAGGIDNPPNYDRAARIAVSQLAAEFGRTENLSRDAQSDIPAAVEGVDSSREQILPNVEADHSSAIKPHTRPSGMCRRPRSVHKSDTRSEAPPAST